MVNDREYKEWEHHTERVGDCMLVRSPLWERKLYGFDPNGRGDMVWRNTLYSIARQDEELLMMSVLLCKDGKRWPDWLEPGRKERRRLRKQGYKPYRKQGNMTRDPYIMTLVAIAHHPDFHTTAWAKQIRVPWHLNRPALYCWHRVLKGGGDKWMARYERWAVREMRLGVASDNVQRWLKRKRDGYKVKGPAWKEKLFRWLHHKSIFGLPAYAVHLAAWQAYTVKSRRVQSFILGSLDIPHWNYVIKLLCGDPTVYLAERFITGYVAKTGYEWGQWERKGEKLPTGEKYKLTKEILDWLWDTYEQKHN